MGETIHHVNGMDICAEVTGPTDGEPLLLVMGLGAQKNSWDQGFVEGIADRGFRVVWFDNRDVGHSTHLHGVEVDVMAVLGGDATAPYLLADMAADAAGLLDALGIDSAHVVGASMGGMIVQQLAIDHPHKVRSATSIMSTTGDRDVGQPTEEASARLVRPPATTEEDAVRDALEMEHVWGSPAYPMPEAVEARARREWNRVRDPAGVVRQIAAIYASPSRTDRLGAVTVPFTVIHGTADTLVTPSGGARTAEAVPHARHVEFEGMGHNLPEALWPEIIDVIVATTRQSATV